MIPGTEQNEDFRDSLSTLDESGNRKWIYPKKPKGRFYKWRSILSVFFLGFLFSAPFIKINGEPLLLFNLLERKFVLFGVIFWPQDFHLFMLAMIALIVFIIIFTVVFGRIFCGWICPQTIFMELVFRKIEYWIEGDHNKQRKLDAAPWTRDKVMKKGFKHFLFLAISFLIANTFLAYIIGVDALKKLIIHPPTDNLSTFIAVVVFSGAFYFVFSRFREQVCTNVCPYGRLQGVLLDNDSIVVAYDNVRGEPRGKMKKNKDPLEVITSKLGDCIDCTLCVQVCPTGIDIRNGTQLECVNCTACIDACDEVMDKIDRPRGLIRYDSYNGIMEGNGGFKFTKRVMAYSVVLVLLLGVLGFSLGSRADFEATILRTPGQLYQRADDGTISNLYNIQFINKQNEAFPIRLELTSHEGTVEMIGEQELRIPAQGFIKSVFFVKIDPKELDSRKTNVKIKVLSGDREIDMVTTAFMGPKTK